MKNQNANLTYEELLKKTSAELSEVRQEAVAKASDFLKEYREDIKEIEFLQDEQRRVRVNELRRMLVRHLSLITLYAFTTPEEYHQVFSDEILKIYDFE